MTRVVDTAQRTDDPKIRELSLEVLALGSRVETRLPFVNLAGRLRFGKKSSPDGKHELPKWLGEGGFVCPKELKEKKNCWG